MWENNVRSRRAWSSEDVRVHICVNTLSAWEPTSQAQADPSYHAAEDGSSEERGLVLLPPLVMSPLPPSPSLPFRLQRMERLKNVRWSQRALPPAVADNNSLQEVEVSPPGGGPSMPCCMPGVGGPRSVRSPAGGERPPCMPGVGGTEVSPQQDGNAFCMLAPYLRGGAGQVLSDKGQHSLVVNVCSTRPAVLQGI